jgi:hypothetical protein
MLTMNRSRLDRNTPTQTTTATLARWLTRTAVGG